MPFVRITIVGETLADDPAAKKAAISSQVTAAIAEATGLSEREISVVFDEVDAGNWYVGRIDVGTLRSRSQQEST
ncbi:4-oxalocrotonate tautomerase [Ensifer sp. T173]|uniref:4-oxalocrotonate tautomerase n=1 Tax=Ensifer canadensis TaxID=555315 RepID=A0AAW4FXW3_9HYPH|nr:tautomerase family protein [Ensifer canadensis]MBM3096095.1 4-oxalocrotonate tautomerase [Ensifer canadensis]UBI79500.1 tautomerase family protein [Ensifer canadensis]